MTLIEPRFRGLFLSVFALFTLFGTSMTIIGATLPKILANFHWNWRCQTKCPRCLSPW